MRRIFLVRHGCPEKAGEKEYIGVTNVPLSARGIEEAEKLGCFFREQLREMGPSLRIFTSPLERCRRTAMEIYRVLSVENQELPIPEVVEDLHEIDLGAWEGKRVREIREHFPEAYAARGQQLGTYHTAGGESFLEAGRRFQKAVEEILASTDEDLLIVAHAGVLRTYLSLLMERDLNRLMELPMPCAGITTLYLTSPEEAARERIEEENRGGPGARKRGTGELETHEATTSEGVRITVRPDDIGVRPEELLDETEIRKLYQKYETPERVIRHMRKVAEVAQQLMDGRQPEQLREADGPTAFPLSKDLQEGLHTEGTENPSALGPLNRARIMKACLLHDLCRTVPQHAHVTGEVLRKEGYPMIAALVAGHHDADDTEAEAEGPLTEAELLFYADKRVQEDRIVPVAARFQESRKKCRSPEARTHHAAMLAKTLRIEEKLERLHQRKTDDPKGSEPEGKTKTAP